ncbi:MAG: hypothetical protein WBA48_17860 [Xanthobacteraceae bacterium]
MDGSLIRPTDDSAEEWFGNEAFFLRRGDTVSTVTSGSAAVNFDPDVFADALVFAGAPLAAAGFVLTALFHTKSSSLRRIFCAQNATPCGDGYRFAKHHGKPAIQKCGKSANGRAF